jgi:hypothetical protein
VHLRDEIIAAAFEASFDVVIKSLICKIFFFKVILLLLADMLTLVLLKHQSGLLPKNAVVKIARSSTCVWALGVRGYAARSCLIPGLYGGNAGQ